MGIETTGTSTQKKRKQGGDEGGVRSEGGKEKERTLARIKSPYFVSYILHLTITPITSLGPLKSWVLSSPKTKALTPFAYAISDH